jgi:hypothetical protein
MKKRQALVLTQSVIVSRNLSFGIIKHCPAVRRTLSYCAVRYYCQAASTAIMINNQCCLAHAVIDSRGGIWTKSAVWRRARLTINQDNETNASIASSRYRSNISARISRITDTVRPKRFKTNKLCESRISQISSFSKLNKPDRLIIKTK